MRDRQMLTLDDVGDEQGSTAVGAGEPTTGQILPDLKCKKIPGKTQNHGHVNKMTSHCSTLMKSEKKMKDSKEIIKCCQLDISPGQLFHQLGVVRRKKLHHEPQDCVLGALTQKYTWELDIDHQAEKYSKLLMHETMQVHCGTYVSSAS